MNSLMASILIVLGFIDITVMFVLFVIEVYETLRY